MTCIAISHLAHTAVLYLLLVNKLGLKRGKNIRSYFIQEKERSER